MHWLRLMFCVVVGNFGVFTYTPQDLGPMHIYGKYGELTPKHEPLSIIDEQASDNLKYFFEKFRIFFKTGLGSIPPLDPYYNPKTFTTRIEDYEIQGAIHLANFHLTGAQQFIINSVEVRVLPGRVDISLDVPKLTVHVDFCSDVKVDEFSNNVLGHANVTFNNVRIITAIEVESLPPDAKIQDQKLSINALKYELKSTNVQYNLRNCQQLPEKHTKAAVHRRLQSCLKATSSLLIKEIALEISEKLSYTSAVSIVTELNKLLDHYSKAQILAMLIPEFITKLLE